MEKIGKASLVKKFWKKVVDGESTIAAYSRKLHRQPLEGLFPLICVKAGGYGNVISVHRNCTELYFDPNTKEFVIVLAKEDCCGHDCGHFYSAREVGRLRMGEEETLFAEKVVSFYNLRKSFAESYWQKLRSKVPSAVLNDEDKMGLAYATIKASRVFDLKTQLEMFGRIIDPPSHPREKVGIEEAAEILGFCPLAVKEAWEKVKTPDSPGFSAGDRIPWWKLPSLQEELRQP